MYLEAALTIITLTTDFGTRDGYVGAMKGVILSRTTSVQLVDLAHHVPAHDIVAGAYCLHQAVDCFPAGTIHLAVVDPGVGSAARAPVIIDTGRYLFVGPDNGLFSLVTSPSHPAYAISRQPFVRTQVSNTFHGRDIFAAAAGALAAGADPSDAGPQVALKGRLSDFAPVADAAHAGSDSREMMATVIYIDTFGNLITDVPAGQLPAKPRFRVAGRIIERLSKTFADVDAGVLLAYIGSAGTLEIAVREQSAAAVLGLGRGTVVEILPS